MITPFNIIKLLLTVSFLICISIGFIHGETSVLNITDISSINDIHTFVKSQNLGYNSKHTLDPVLPDFKSQFELHHKTQKHFVREKLYQKNLADRIRFLELQHMKTEYKILRDEYEIVRMKLYKMDRFGVKSFEYYKYLNEEKVLREKIYSYLKYFKNS